MRWILISFSLIFTSFFILSPLILIFSEAFSKGIKSYFEVFAYYETLEAIKLSLIVCGICLPINIIFSLVSGWCLGKFQFKGRNLLITLVDLPFSVPPIIVGVTYSLLFGYGSKFGTYLLNHDIRIIFNSPSIIIATLFVTLPIISKEVINLMVSQGKSQEEAGFLLGADLLKLISKVTLPNVKWSLLSGILLANSRALGEYGSVSVVSGHIRGLTNTMPLQIETLYNEYNMQAAFTVASLMTIIAIITSFGKFIAKSKMNKGNI